MKSTSKKNQAAITPEEMRLKFKHEKATYWLHSTPLFGLIKTIDGFQFFPVEQKVTDNVLILFVLDPTDYTSERVLELIDLFRKRYRNLPWISAIVFDVKYNFTKNPQFWDHFKKQAVFQSLPTYLDTFDEFSKWAKIENFPKAFFLTKGQVTAEYTLDGNLEARCLELEQKLQDSFRLNDRGLPLPLLYEYEMDAPVDRKKPLLKDLDFKGHWVTTADNTVTDDLGAVLTIPFEGKRFRFVGSLHTQAREATSRVIVTLNDKPIPQACLTPFLIADSHGITSFEVSRFQGIYDLIDSKDPLKGLLKFHFKNAANSPVIYQSCKID